MKKKTFYCAILEIYANGTTRTGIKTQVCKTIPNNQIGRNQIMTAYFTWFDTRQQAEAHLSRKAA